MTISLRSTPWYASLVDTVADRASMSAAAAYGVLLKVKPHVVRIARRRHATSDALGASHTQHMEQGANDIQRVDGNAISIPILGFARVFGDVHVTPRRARALTIPVNAVSYGRRAADMGQFGYGELFTKSTKRGGENGILFGRRADGTVDALYRLVRSATLRKDRSLLPSDEEMAAGARRGIVLAAERRQRGL